MNATATAIAIIEPVKQLLADKLFNFVQLPLDQIPQRIFKYIRGNPVQSVFNVASLVSFFCPAFLSGPILSAFGLTLNGPRAASFAAMFQSYFGTHWLFSFCQSAAMGINGWRAWFLASTIRTGALSSFVAAPLTQFLTNNNNGTRTEL